MPLSRDTMLQGMYNRDASQNGRYVVAVLTTSIYCLPSCAARKPKAENVVFFEQPQSAIERGFRACLRCKPDQFYLGQDPELDRLQDAMSALQSTPSEFPNVRALADAVGCGPTKLAALLRAQFHVTPARALSNARTKAAQTLLRTGELKAADAGFEVGFESVAAFYQNFKRAAGMSPGDYSQLGKTQGVSQTFKIALPRGFDATAALSLLARDADGVCEQVDGQSFAKGYYDGRRTLKVQAHVRGSGVHCEVRSRQKLPGESAYAAHTLVSRLLGLSGDGAGLSRCVRDVPALQTLIAIRPGLRVPLMGDVFEALTWAIIGQQINLKFASTLRTGLIRLAGKRAPQGGYAHPHPEVVAQLQREDLLALKFSRSKADYLIGISQAVALRQLPLQADSLAADRLLACLCAQRGIGEWTSNYVMMRGYGLADCTPAGDTGLSSGLQRVFGLSTRPDTATQRALLQPYSPHRSLLCQHLWASGADYPTTETPADSGASNKAAAKPGNHAES